ncbi:MAG: hypothetical protein ACXW14_12360 [Burkholderiaceae bacterium]
MVIRRSSSIAAERLPDFLSIAMRWRFAALAGSQLRGAVPVFQMLVQKELKRGHPLEALGFYQVLLRALIELLGMKYRPDRFDFGWRYVETELPEHARQLIERYAFVADPIRLQQLSSDVGHELTRQLETTTP